MPVTASSNRLDRGVNKIKYILPNIDPWQKVWPFCLAISLYIGNFKMRHVAILGDRYVLCMYLNWYIRQKWVRIYL